MRTALLPALLLLATFAIPPSQAAGVALVVTTPATANGDVAGINCAVSNLGLAVITGVVVYGANELRVGDAFYDDIGTVASPYGNGLFMDGAKLAAPPYSLTHTYVIEIPTGGHCFTFQDSNYNDNVGAIAILVL